MMAVALSGVMGRFLYLQIPRTRAGEELSLSEVQGLDQSLSEQLRRDFRLSEAALLRLNGLSAPPEAERRGLRRGLLGLLFGNRELRRDLRAFAQECRTVPRGVFREFERVALQKALAPSPDPALGPAARALPLLARVPQAVRCRHVHLHDRAHRGGGDDGIRMGRTRLMARVAGRTAIALGLGLSARAVPVHAQISPGKLSRGHAALEGSASCLKCHEESGPPRAKCRTCHGALGERIDAGKGLHARAEYRECATCHVEHQGLEAELVWWGKEGRDKLDHRLTGYPLEGKHTGLACASCHQAKFVQGEEALKKGGADPAHTYLGLSHRLHELSRRRAPGPVQGQGVHELPHPGGMEARSRDSITRRRPTLSPADTGRWLARSATPPPPGMPRGPSGPSRSRRASARAVTKTCTRAASARPAPPATTRAASSSRTWPSSTTTARAIP